MSYSFWIQSELMISWLSFGVTTGERSFFGMSSTIVFIFSDTPFCTTFAFSLAVVFPPAEVLLAIFDVTVVFLVGDAVVVVLVTEDTRFTVLVVVPVAETRLVLVVLLVRPMDICLLAVSFTCLSMIGNLADDCVRGFAAFPTRGAVFGLAAAVVAVVALGFAVVLGLLAVLADAGLGFAVVVVPVNVRVVEVLVLTSEVFVVDETLLTGGFVAAGLLEGFTSPFVVGFLSLAAAFGAVAAGFGFAMLPMLVLVVDFAVVELAVVAFGAGFESGALLVVGLERVVFFGASRSFGRAANDVAGFFAPVAEAFVVEVTVFEGDVGNDFCGVFDVVAFVGLAAGLVFSLLCAVAAAAPTAVIAAAATATPATNFSSEALVVDATSGSLTGEQTSTSFGGTSSVAGGATSSVAGRATCSVAGRAACSVVGGETFSVAGGETSSVAGGATSSVAGGETSSVAGGATSSVSGGTASTTEAAFSSEGAASTTIRTSSLTAVEISSIFFSPSSLHSSIAGSASFSGSVASFISSSCFGISCWNCGTKLHTIGASSGVFSNVGCN